jgi:signal peptidase II
VTPAARHAGWVYGVAAAAYALDRATKIWAEHALALRPPVVLIPGVLQLAYTTNSGGAFGIGTGTPLAFVTASVVVIAAIVVASTRRLRPVVAVGLGLVLGGALGNVTDRLLRGPNASGRVVDFIDLHVWPVFNVADSAIVLGALVMVAAGLRGERAGTVADPEDGRAEGT